MTLGAKLPAADEPFVVEVPATSANLGVGFDCLGLALDLVARFTFQRSPVLDIHDRDPRYCNPRNLVWTSMLTALAALGESPVPVHLRVENPVPLAGGLGSSSTCVVAGVVAAQAILGREPDPTFTLDVATQIEGHPDNVAPATLGGLVSSFVTEGSCVPTRFSVGSNLRFVAVSPTYSVRTSDARRVLPETVTRETCVWQMGRCVAVAHALEQGDAELFGQACQDLLHEPYRKALIPDYEPLRATALDAGANAFFISGSGATMIALAGDDATAEKVADSIREVRPAFELHVLSARNEGASVRPVGPSPTRA